MPMMMNASKSWMTLNVSKLWIVAYKVDNDVVVAEVGRGVDGKDAEVNGVEAIDVVEAIIEVNVINKVKAINNVKAVDKVLSHDVKNTDIMDDA